MSNLDKCEFCHLVFNQLQLLLHNYKSNRYNDSFFFKAAQIVVNSLILYSTGLVLRKMGWAPIFEWNFICNLVQHPNPFLKISFKSFIFIFGETWIVDAIRLQILFILIFHRPHYPIQRCTVCLNFGWL